MTALNRLLWFDSVAGGTVALLTLVLGSVLSPLFGVPRGLLLFLAIANATYGAFSFSLARQANPSPRLVRVLVIANGAWSFVCAGMVLYVRPEATWVGQGYLCVEGVFVGALAIIEARALDHATRDTSSSTAPDKNVGT